MDTTVKDAAPSWAKSLANYMKKTFCRSLDVQYKQYHDTKKSIKLNKVIARKMDMEVSPAGSEENIKTPSQWKAQNGYVR